MDKMPYKKIERKASFVSSPLELKDVKKIREKSYHTDEEFLKKSRDNLVQKKQDTEARLLSATEMNKPRLTELKSNYTKALSWLDEYIEMEQDDKTDAWEALEKNVGANKVGKPEHGHVLSAMKNAYDEIHPEEVSKNELLKKSNTGNIGSKQFSDILSSNGSDQNSSTPLIGKSDKTAIPMETLKNETIVQPSSSESKDIAIDVDDEDNKKTLDKKSGKKVAKNSDINSPDGGGDDITKEELKDKPSKIADKYKQLYRQEKQRLQNAGTYQLAEAGNPPDEIKIREKATKYAVLETMDWLRTRDVTGDDLLQVLKTLDHHREAVRDSHKLKNDAELQRRAKVADVNPANWSHYQQEAIPILRMNRSAGVTNATLNGVSFGMNFAKLVVDIVRHSF